MNAISRLPRPESLALLRRLAQPRRPGEACELCSIPVPAAHRHLLRMEDNQITCACDACALLFQGVTGGRFKLVPRDTRRLPGFRMSQAEWDGLMLPIQLVFILQNTRAGKPVAYYPSPGGPTEALLPPEQWAALSRNNPCLARMQADVEALLINRLADAREYFIAPIDTCYELVGLIRTHWRGFSGGTEVWEQIAGFFANLKDRSHLEQELAVEGPHA